MDDHQRRQEQERDSLFLGESKKDDGELSSKGLFSSVSSSPSRNDSPFSFEKNPTQYATPATSWMNNDLLTALPLPQGFGFSRRYRFLAVWTAGLLALIVLFRVSSSSHHHILPNDDNGNINWWGFERRGHHIPTKIWQVMFVDPHTDTADGTPSYDFDEMKVPYTNSWVARNPDWQYTLVGTEGANRFVRKHFAHDERIKKIHFGLRNHGPRSDIMRYLLMLIEGGVYSDTDVTCIKPVDQWIPPRWRDKVQAVVGIEGDSFGEGVIEGMLWDVQFGQWTVAAVPGHRLFRHMVENVVNRLEDLCALKNTTIDQLEMTAIEIMNSTATALWSETIFHELQLIDPSLKEPLDLSGMQEPRLYGDIMVLPINGIGFGVEHSGSTHDGTIPEIAIVQHHFHGSWRDGDGIENV